MKERFAKDGKNETQLERSAVGIWFLGLSAVFILSFLMTGISLGTSKAPMKAKSSLLPKNPKPKATLTFTRSNRSNMWNGFLPSRSISNPFDLKINAGKRKVSHTDSLYQERF